MVSKWGRKKRGSATANNSPSGSPINKSTSGRSVQFGTSVGTDPALSKHASTNSMSSHRKSISGAAASQQLVELMGARLCCLVEENTYFRDKVLHYGSLGLLGRRGFSDARNGSGDTQGTIWRPRVLVVTTTSVAMFGVKRGSGSSSSSAAAMAAGTSKNSSNPNMGKNTSSGTHHKTISKYAHSKNASGKLNNRDESLIHDAGDPKNIIAMEDVTDIRTDGKDECLLHVRSALLNGSFRDTVIRTQPGDRKRIYDVIIQAQRAFNTALDALKSGCLDDGYGIHVVAITTEDRSPTAKPGAIKSTYVNNRKSDADGEGGTGTSETTRARGGSDASLPEALQGIVPAFQEQVAMRTPSWGSSVTLSNATPTSVVRFYLTTVHGAHTATLEMQRLLNVVGNYRRLHKDEDNIDTMAIPVVVGTGATLGPGSKTILCLDLECTVGPMIKTPISNQSSAEAGGDSSGALEEKAGNDKLGWVWPFAGVMLPSACVALIALVPQELLTRHNLVGIAVALWVGGVTCALYLYMHHRALQKSNEQTTTENVDSSSSSGNFNETFETTITINTFHVGEAARRTMSVAKLQALAAGDEEDDGEPPDSALPQAWIDATEGNIPESIRQWRDSLLWRKNNNVDDALTWPQDKFDTIKKHFVATWLGGDKQGNLVTLEKFGRIKEVVHNLKDDGVTDKDFMWHSVLMNEFWMSNRLSRTGKLTKVVDLSGLRFADLSRDVLRYFGPMNEAMQQYPELINVVFIINSPTFFTFCWRAVAPMLAKRTREKIKVLGSNPKAVLEGLSKVIDKSEIPKEFGGDSPLGIQDGFPEKISRKYAHAITEASPEQRPRIQAQWAAAAARGEPGVVSALVEAPGSVAGAPPDGDILPVASEVGVSFESGGLPEPTALGSPPLGERAGISAIQKAHEQVLNSMTSTWTPDKKLSESMGPLLSAQGMPSALVFTVKRATMVEAFSVSGKNRGDQQLPIVTIQANVGPMNMQFSVPVGDKTPTPIDGGRMGDTTILGKMCDTPEPLSSHDGIKWAANSFEIVRQFAKSGDVRRDTHTLQAAEAGTVPIFKRVIITFEKKSNGAQTKVVQVQRRTK